MNPSQQQIQTRLESQPTHDLPKSTFHLVLILGLSYCTRLLVGTRSAKIAKIPWDDNNVANFARSFSMTIVITRANSAYLS